MPNGGRASMYANEYPTPTLIELAQEYTEKIKESRARIRELEKENEELKLDVKALKETIRMMK